MLSLLATTPVPLGHWLEVWNAQPPGPADLHAVDLCVGWMPEVLAADLTVGWSRPTDLTTDIKRWILEDARPRLERVPASPLLTEYLELLTD